MSDSNDKPWVPSNDRFEGNADDFEFLPVDEEEPADPEQAEDEFLKWTEEMDARDRKEQGK